MLGRRDFLGAIAAAPFAFRRTRKNCIFLVLTGGPSQIDTWDPKPDAPSEVRGPFRAIRTNVPGIEISEIFPRMARHADKYTLVRSVFSENQPDHESGMQLINQATEGFVTLPGPIGFMGGKWGGRPRPRRTPGSGRSVAIGVADAGFGRGPGGPPYNSFAANCVRAMQLIEAGVANARVNMFDTVFNRTTWDSHGTKPFSTIADYKETVGPIFDAAYSTLLEDLHQRGLLESTLVVAMGEFGRSPRLNPQGGRDHWTRCQTVVLAGGGIQGGQVYGSSDATGAEPKDKPVSIEEILEIVRTGSSPVRDLLS